MTTSPQGRYAQVAAYLRDRIVRGELGPGARLPSEPELAEQFGLSRPTINKAIHVLVSQGLVLTEHGRGSFVRQHRSIIQMSSAYVTADAKGRRSGWAQELAAQGLRGSQRIMDVRVEEPTVDVAVCLHLDEGVRVVARRRVMLLDSEAVQLVDSFYPATLAVGSPLADRRKLRGGTVAALERLGIELGDFEESLVSRMPTESEARKLAMAPGIPVFDMTRVTYAVDGAPVEVCKGIMRGDQHRFSYRLPAKS